MTLCYTPSSCQTDRSLKRADIGSTNLSRVYVYIAEQRGDVEYMYVFKDRKKVGHELQVDVVSLYPPKSSLNSFFSFSSRRVCFAY